MIDVIVLAVFLFGNAVEAVHVSTGPSKSECIRVRNAEHDIHYLRWIGSTYKGRVVMPKDFKLDCIKTPSYPLIVNGEQP